MPASTSISTLQRAVALGMIWLMLSVVATPIMDWENLDEPIVVRSTGEVWNETQQPWAQYARTPTHNQTVPDHGPDGGPGDGAVSDVTQLATLHTPVVNWQVFSEQTESDAYGSVIGDFSQSVSASESAVERCGAGTLFPVMVSSEFVDGNRQSHINIVTGNDAKVAWKASLGTTDAIRSTPMIHDLDQDGYLEIIVVYDTDGAFNIDVWSPRLTCTESNWQTSGHSNELVWSYTDADVRIGSPSPHFATANSDHMAVTQPLLADLELDGTPELVVALVDDPTNNPLVKVNAYELSNVQPTEAAWSVSLDRGTHPSDPVWAQLDSSTTSVVLTTIDGDSGNMWIWKIDGSSGSLDWERVAVQGTDTDSDSPRLRLPGPVIVQLDQDSAPEMIVTVPTDANGRTPGNGARFIGMELTSTTEVFNFRAQNGYADAHPIALDTDDDGIDDRLCWVTWYSESALNFNRKGMLGCTDISDETPVTEWTRDLQRGAGNDNDEIAASPPFWLDIDGEGTPEVLVGFGRRFWAFDGDTGASADINSAWSTPLNMPHRVWTAPAVADVDGDGHVDVLYGDTLVSNQGPDLTPALDGRGLSFNPAQADPGTTVTVTGQFANVGTGEADEDIDASILMNGVELTRQRFVSSEPVAPSGEGGPLTFSAEFVAQLGVHQFELVLDVNDNITEQREDNNRAESTLTVVEPYLADLTGPLETPRIPPGTSQQVEVDVMATGSRTASWTLAYTTDQLPDGWTFFPANGESLTRELVPDVSQTITFDASIPSTALGDESGMVSLVLTLDDDQSVNTTLDLQIDVYRTRGLDLAGSTGMNESNGHGRPGHTAKAWFMVENLGNAQETTTSITWTAPSWGGSPSIHDESGTQLFSISLQPGESKILFAHLPTPSSVSYGSSTHSTLTLCMGSGESALCESMPFSFTAEKVVAAPNHHRTLPDRTLTWTVEGTLPASGVLQWNMASMNMHQTNWAWSTTGDLSQNGSLLEAQGTPSDAFSGEVVLNLPKDAVPKRHLFVATDAIDLDATLNISLQVLQVHRANLSLIEPTPVTPGTAISLNVSEPHRFLVFLSNPGNGEDTFELSAVVSSALSTSTPEVEFTFFDPQKTLGALATSIGTVDVLLSSEIPALEPFDLTFTWTSLDGEGIASSIVVPVQAAQSHEWSVVPVGSFEQTAGPGETVTYLFNVTNDGNAPDDLELSPTLSVNALGDDAAVWTATTVSTDEVGVNQTTVLNVSINVPDQAWAGSSVNIQLDHVANGYIIGGTSLELTVQAVSGWRLNLTNADLEVEPGGENLTFQLIHTGNAYERPYFAKAGAGWNITLPDNASDVAPFATTTFDVHVQPPDDALAGEVGVLRIRITGNDTSGMIVEEIPVRVGAAPQINVDHRGSWTVNENGGFPTVWVENQGNDVAFLTLDIDGLPEGWSVAQGTQLILAPGEFAGLPLNLTPASDWNEQRFLVTINVNHPLLGTTPHTVEIEHGLVTFTQTPVVDAFISTNQALGYVVSGTEAVEFAGPLDVVKRPTEVQFIQPETTGEYVLSFTLGNETGNLSTYVIARTYPDASIACDFVNNVFDNLGREVLPATVATCLLTASEDEDLRAVLTMVTSSGERIHLDDDVAVVRAGGQTSLNISVKDWAPGPGLFDVQLTGHDQFGRELEHQSTSVVARATGWNVGIHSIEASGDIEVGIKRSGYDILADAVCELTVKAESGWETKLIVDITYPELLASPIGIDNPGGLTKDEKITASIACSVPFDLDDTPEDDQMSDYYETEGLLAVSTNDVGWIVGVAGLVLALAWLLGFVNPAQKTTANVGKASRSEKQTAAVAEDAEEDEITVEEDDFNLQIEDTGERAVVEDVSQDTAEVTVEETTIEVIEAIDEEDQPEPTASGRLASLRQEIGTDEAVQPEGSIEDRMSKFFGNDR